MADSLEEYVETSTLLERLTRVEIQAAKAKSSLALARAQNRELVAERDSYAARVAVYEKAAGQKPPSWVSPKKPKRSEATVVVMLSDLHLDEVVNPDELGGVNAYDRRIARMRLKRFAAKTIELSRDYVAGVDVAGCVVLWGGDMVSGDIHDELKESNEAGGLATCVHWSKELAACMETLANHFGRVHVACVVGNHGRQTRKPRAKGRVRDNLDWLLSTMTANHMVDDKRVTWDIPDTPDCMVTVYDTKILLTHGDQIRGSSNGIGGLFAPAIRYRTKRLVNDDFDCLAFGHFHSLILANEVGFIANGSMKGVDEFSRLCAFPDQEPMQAWLLCTPEHGISLQAPIYVGDRQKEGW